MRCQPRNTQGEEHHSPLVNDTREIVMHLCFGHSVIRVAARELSP